MVEFLGVLGEGGNVPMIGDSDDGQVLDLGDSREVRALCCIGAGLFQRADFRAWAGSYAEAARWLLGRADRAQFEAAASAPANELMAGSPAASIAGKVIRDARPTTAVTMPPTRPAPKSMSPAGPSIAPATRAAARG